MKPNIISRKLFSIGVALVVAALALSTQAAQLGSARVIKLKGKARYSTGNNYWQPVSVGTVLKPGAIIQTASQSWMDVVLNNGEDNLSTTPAVNESGYTISGGDALQNVVRLRENTLLVIDKLLWEQTGADTVTDTELDLRAGSIFGNVKKASAASRYEVKLPNGVAGIRGTIYDFSADGILKVYVGSVVLTYIDPNNPGETITKVINAGQQFNLNTDTYSPIPTSDLKDAQGQAPTMSEGQPPQTILYPNDVTVLNFTSPVSGNNTPPPPPPE